MPNDSIQPLQGLNRMSLSNLSDREKEAWYAANQNALSKYNPRVRRQAAEQIYQNQQFVKKFGKEEFYKTAAAPEAAAFRRKQLENRLIEEAWRKTFRPKTNVVTDINTGKPYTKNGQPLTFIRDDKDVNVSDAWYAKYSGMDYQAKKELLEAYGNGTWQPEMEVQKNNVFSKFEEKTPSTVIPALKYLLGDKSEENKRDLAEASVKASRWGIFAPQAELIGGIAGMIGAGRHEYNVNSRLVDLDKIYDESSHRIAESPEVSRFKKDAYLDGNIVGNTDEETRRIFYNIITPTDPDSPDAKDYEKANLGIPTYAACFDGGKNIQKEVQDIDVNQMREIIATKYAMEKAGIPKLQVKDMLEREAQKHVANNEGWWKGKYKFAKDVIIASAAYTADKWNGLKNAYYMAQDSQDGGQWVWVDEKGNPIGELDHPEVRKNVDVAWDKNGDMVTSSKYKGEDGLFHTVHRQKFLRSALLMMGRESNGENVGGKLDSWADPNYWTKAEQFGVFPLPFTDYDEEQIKKWDKIGASPEATVWDPDEKSHILYDSLKMMSFGLADQAMMFIPGGAGVLAKSVTGASKLANATRVTLETISKLGSASKAGQVLNNAAASMGIGFAYGRSNAYELFAKNLANTEEYLRTKSEMELQEKYNTDEEYKAYIDQRRDELTQANIQRILAENAEDIKDGRVVIDNDMLQQQAAYEAYQQIQEEELHKQIELNKNTKEYQDLQQSAINSAAYTSNLMAVSDALKYFAVGAYGYRRYLYENPGGLFKQTGNTVKEALRGTKSALKHVKEFKNAEGKFRLSTTVGKDFTGVKNLAKQWGKTFKDQFIGGAWTNGTDDMQVDGVQQINDDSMQQMHDAYLAGEPIANVYGPLDQISSAITGMGRSLGQKSTWDVTLIGGLGSTISGNLNFANIVSICTKKGREAFREQYGTRYLRDSEGYIKYEDRPVLDAEGNPVKGENGETIMEKVPVKEQIGWKQNWGERLSFFIQNGMLNTFYGNKQAAFTKVDRIQTANKLLDDLGDFEDLEDYITADATEDNVESEREKRTSRFLKALRMARALEQVGKTAEGKRDIDDPLLKSSVYQQAKDFIRKANSMEIYDTGVNIGDFTPAEVEDMLKEWYSQNPQETRSQSKDVEVLRGIAENAKELTTAMDDYDNAVDHVKKSEAESNKEFSSHVRNKMVEDYVLYKHWKGRYDKMRRELNDASSPDRQLSAEEFIASVGGISNAEHLVSAYDLMIDETKANDKPDIDKAVESSRKKLEAARRKYDNAESVEDKQAIQKEVAKAQAEYDKDLANQEYVDGIISRLEQKRDQAATSLEQTRAAYSSELQEDLGHLSQRKQQEAISRALRLISTRKKIEEYRRIHKNDKQSLSADETREFNRLQKQEKVDQKWLRNNLEMSDAQIQQFMARANELNTINAQGRILSADEIMALDPITRSNMLDVNNRNLYSVEQLKEIDKLRGQLSMKDPTALTKIHDIARLGQQMDRVMDAYKRLSQHPEGAALAIETDREIAANAAYQVIDRRFALDVANFIMEFDDKIIVNSTDESNDIVSAMLKYKDRTLNFAGVVRFLEARQKVFDMAKFQGRKPQVTQREKDNAVFQLLRTLNGRILDILDQEHYIEKYRTELDKARQWVSVVEDIATIIDETIMDPVTKDSFNKHIFQLVFFCDDKEDIMRQLEIEANNPSEPEFTANILNLLDDLEELNHLRNATVAKRNAEKYKEAFQQKAKALIEKSRKTVEKALGKDTSDELEDFINNLSEEARTALEKILANSKVRVLNEDGSRYIIDEKGHVRVTSVKHLLNGSTLSRFDSSNPWALPSSLIGNSLDEFGRDVFNGIYDNMTEEQRLEEFKKRYSNSTAENYEKVYKALKDFQNKLKDKNQRIIRLGNSLENQGSAVAAGVIDVTMPDGSVRQIRVAGSLDILAIDNKGNLHIYDFKTYHSNSKLSITDAVAKGYDRQLSMYAKLLEEEYGLKVASINILPVHAEYPAPTTQYKKGATYKQAKEGSNQLRIKEKGKVKYKEFKEANFRVEGTFQLVRLGDDRLSIDYSKLSDEDKAEVDALLAEQSAQGPIQNTRKKIQNPIETEEAVQNGEAEDIDLEEDTAETETQEEKDPLFDDIAYLIQGETSISVPWLMREFNIGSRRALKIIEQLEKAGYIGRFNTTTKSRTVLKRAPSMNIFDDGITTTAKKGNKEVSGHYHVERDGEDYVHIVFDRGNAAAKRSVPTSELSESTLSQLNNGRNLRQMGINTLSITEVIVTPEGNVVIGTLWGNIEGAAARQILDKAFPELKNYMQRFDQQAKHSEQTVAPIKVEGDVERVKESLEAVPGRVYYSEKTDSQGYRTIKFARGIVKKNGTPAVIAGKSAGVFVDLPIKELIDDDSYSTFYEETDIWDKSGYRVSKIIIGPNGEISGTILLKEADSNSMVSFDVAFKVNPMEHLAKDQLSQKMRDVLNRQNQDDAASQPIIEQTGRGENVDSSESSTESNTSVEEQPRESEEIDMRENSSQSNVAEEQASEVSDEVKVITEGIHGVAEGLRENFAKGTAETREKDLNKWLQKPAVRKAFKEYCKGATSVEDVINKALAETTDEEARAAIEHTLRFESTRSVIQELLNEVIQEESLDTDALHDNGTDVWVDSTEGNISEANATEGFDLYDVDNPTAEEINEEAEEPSVDTQVSDQGADNADTRILPLSGNSMPVYHNTLHSSLATEGKPVTRVEYQEEQARNNGQPIIERDTSHVFDNFLNGLGIKLDEIISEELAPIFMRNPDTPIKYMAVNWVSEQFRADKPLSDVCFLVIDYTGDVKRIHNNGKNGRKNTGGVITAQGKEYLIIGTVGYGNGKTPDGQRRLVFRNKIFYRGSHKEAPGFVKKAAADYFLNHDHDGERFYVATNPAGEFYSTKYKKGSLTPGWRVRGPKVRLSQLLYGPNKLQTNPFNLRWDTLDFGICEYTKFFSTMDGRAVMEPADRIKNAGRAFVLIPAGNGKYMPAYLQPVKYSELIADSPLEQKIDELVDGLLARNHKDRVDALKKLYKYFYIKSGESETDVNILLRKTDNIISIEKAGKILKRFNLDDASFDRQEFKAVLKEANPLINITPGTLRDIEELQRYDESGALLLDLTKLSMSGSNFEIWPSTETNEVLMPEEPMSQHHSESERITGTQIPYMGQYYVEDVNGVFRDREGMEVTDASIIEDLKINKRINEAEIEPVKRENNTLTYILDQSLDNPLVVQVHSNTYEVTRLSTEDAVEIIQEEINKREQRERDEAAKEELERSHQQPAEDATPSQPLTPEQVRQQELDDIEENSYNRMKENLQNDEHPSSTEVLQSMIDDTILPLMEKNISPEERAEFQGYLRAYQEEIDRRKQQEQPVTPPPVRQPEQRPINQRSDNAGTITFLDMFSNKEYQARIMQALRNMPDAPRQKSKLADYLRGKNVEVDAIGNTPEDIEAWFETLNNCR